MEERNDSYNSGSSELGGNYESQKPSHPESSLNYPGEKVADNHKGFEPYQGQEERHSDLREEIHALIEVIGDLKAQENELRSRREQALDKLGTLVELAAREQERLNRILDNAKPLLDEEAKERLRERAREVDKEKNSRVERDVMDKEDVVEDSQLGDEQAL